MAINTTPVQENTVERMTSLALTGHVDSALHVLNTFELSQEQNAKIATILTDSLPNYTLEASQGMNQSIIAVIKGEDSTLNSTSALNDQVSSSQLTNVVPSEQQQSVFIGEPSLSELPSDIIGVLFENCLSQSDWKTLAVFLRLNKYWNLSATNFENELDLKQICPELTIIDAKTQDVKCDDEPKIRNFKILKWVRKVSPHVEENAGVTKLTMTKGTTLNQLIKIAAEAGITVDIGWGRNLKELGNVTIEQTYVILITNSVFMNSREQRFGLQETLVQEHGCKLPTVQEYVALCVFMNKVFKQCPYGKDPLTFGRSSTYRGDAPLIIGATEPVGRLLVDDGDDLDDEYTGAGGRRKL